MSKTTRARGKQPTGAADDFPEFSNGAEFEALSAADKEKVSRYYEQGKHRNKMRPLNATERAEVKREKRRMGRPKIGRGVKVISLSVERDRLKKADAYANRSGLKRAELFTRALRGFLPA